MKRVIISLAVAMIAGTGAMSVMAQDETPTPKFKRSTIHTMLLQSDKQQQKLDEDAKKEGAGTSLIKGIAKTDEKKAAKDDGLSPSQTVSKSFFEIAIPDQFFNANLHYRLIDFDSYQAALTDEDRAEAEALKPKKKGAAFGKMLGNMAKESVGLSTEESPNAAIDADGIAVLYKMIRQKHYADSLTAQWFGYQAPNKWDLNLLEARGDYAATPEQIREAAQQGLTSGLGQQVGLDLIGSTYLIAFNLRFRSNQAIVAEAEAAVGAAAGMVGGGALGGLATTALGAAAGAAAGEGFSVQAVAYLFQLTWDEEIQDRFYNEVFAKNATLDDLISLNLVQLKYIGSEKATARVRQSITNTTPQNVLIARATEQAIDKAICKLQEKNESFRTSFPITEVDGQGGVYAKVGMKEGLAKGDEYEILERHDNPKTGASVWKKVGTVKVVDGEIWDNRAGAADDAAMDLAAATDDEAKAKAEAANKAATLGKTKFVGAKKNQEVGYYLRLKKKK